MSENREAQVDEILTRTVGEFIDPDGAFRKKLIENPDEVVIKFGVDPTRPDIHLGHAVVFRKLRQFQDLGCKVVFLVGDFTAHIGDPSGKDKVRPEVAFEEIQKNVQSFVEQVDSILKVERKEDGSLDLSSPLFSWIRNSDWFYGVTDLMFQPGTVKAPFLAEGGVPSNTFVGKAVLYQQERMQLKELHMKENIQGVTLNTLMFTLKHITFDRLRKRDMFEKRVAEGRPLHMHEMLYPVLQGIDSQILSNIYGSCDLEIGGTDQTFNMLMGRDIMALNKTDQQAVMTLSILEGTDGKEKMSKSLDNYIAITDAPHDMYGKVMSIPDSSLINYFTLCTPLSTDEIEKRTKQLESGKGNPRDIKMELARIIVEMYHGKDKAEEAEKHFVDTFQKGEASEHTEDITAPNGTPLADALKDVVGSKSEVRRLVESGGVSFVGGDKITDANMPLEKDAVLKVGKKRFVKITTT